MADFLRPTARFREADWERLDALLDRLAQIDPDVRRKALTMACNVIELWLDCEEEKERA